MINNVVKIGLIIIIVLYFLTLPIVIISLWNIPFARNLLPFLEISQEFPSKIIAGFTAVLAWATILLAFFTFLTIQNSKEQRLDASRPLLVPVGGIFGIVYLRPGVLGLQIDARTLRIHNIGTGPAENIAVRLELRLKNASPTVQLDEMMTFVEPLASGDKGIVGQWKSAERPVEIYDDHWIVISYDDLFGRHFETEGRYIKGNDGWVSIKTKQVKKLRPRVREVDYYAAAEGRK